MCSLYEYVDGDATNVGESVRKLIILLLLNFSVCSEFFNFFRLRVHLTETVPFDSRLSKDDTVRVLSTIILWIFEKFSLWFCLAFERYVVQIPTKQFFGNFK